MIRKIFGILFILYGGFGTFITIAKLGIISLTTEGLPDVSILQPLGIVESFQDALYIDLVIAMIFLLVGIKLLVHRKKPNVIQSV